VQRTVLDEQTGSIEFEPAKPELKRTGSERLYGRPAIADAMRDVCFPVNKRELIRLIGDRVVEFRRGQPVRMKDAVEKTALGEFASLLEAAHEVHRVLDERKSERRQAQL
jgi:hypothetical protein